MSIDSPERNSWSFSVALLVDFAFFENSEFHAFLASTDVECLLKDTTAAIRVSLWGMIVFINARLLCLARSNLLDNARSISHCAFVTEVGDSVDREMYS